MNQKKAPGWREAQNARRFKVDGYGLVPKALGVSGAITGVTRPTYSVNLLPSELPEFASAATRDNQRLPELSTAELPPLPPA